MEFKKWMGIFFLIITFTLSGCGSTSKSKISVEEENNSIPVYDFDADTHSNSPSWIADQNGCLHYNPNPVPGESVTWTGGCTNGYADGGYADGRGVKKWYFDGKTHVYAGDVKNGKNNGYGVYTWPNRDEYSGEWINSNMHGYGMFVYANGENYIGEFINNERHGYGVYVKSHGSNDYMGEWKNGDLIYSSSWGDKVTESHYNKANKAVKRAENIQYKVQAEARQASNTTGSYAEFEAAQKGFKLAEEAFSLIDGMKKYTPREKEYWRNKVYLAQNNAGELNRLVVMLKNEIHTQKTAQRSYTNNSSNSLAVNSAYSKPSPRVNNVTRQNYLKAKKWLNRSSDVYKNGQCVPLPRPKRACPPDNVENIATAMCAAVLGGCEVASKYVNGSASKFLSSQACGALASKMKGETYSFDDAFERFGTDSLTALAVSGIKSNNLIGNVAGGALAGWLATQKVKDITEDFDKCVGQKITECGLEYAKWKMDNKNYYKSCVEYKEIVDSYNQN